MCTNNEGGVLSTSKNQDDGAVLISMNMHIDPSDQQAAMPDTNAKVLFVH